MEADSSRHFGKYRIIQRLGAGGMAEVFLAELEGPQGFGRSVALKRMFPHLTTEKDFTSWFISEARLGGRLSHPNIVSTLEFGLEEGRYFMVMEYVEGVTLSRLLAWCRDQRTGLPLTVALDIGAQICDGLAYAHSATDSQGIPLRMVHRDLKPANILLSPHGVAKIADFGAAKAASNIHNTVNFLIKGTIAYMSPEQALGQNDLDARSDLYSLGAILFEMLALEQLTPNISGLSEFSRAQRGAVQARLELIKLLPRPLVGLMEALLAFERDARPSSAQEVRKILMRVAASATTSMLDLRDLVREAMMNRPATGATPRASQLAREPEGISEMLELEEESPGTSSLSEAPANLSLSLEFVASDSGAREGVAGDVSGPSAPVAIPGLAARWAGRTDTEPHSSGAYLESLTGLELKPAESASEVILKPIEARKEGDTLRSAPGQIAPAGSSSGATPAGHGAAPSPSRQPDPTPLEEQPTLMGFEPEPEEVATIRDGRIYQRFIERLEPPPLPAPLPAFLPDEPANVAHLRTAAVRGDDRTIVQIIGPPPGPPPEQQGRSPATPSPPYMKVGAGAPASVSLFEHPSQVTSADRVGQGWGIPPEAAGTPGQRVDESTTWMTGKDLTSPIGGDRWTAPADPRTGKDLASPMIEDAWTNPADPRTGTWTHPSSPDNTLAWEAPVELALPLLPEAGSRGVNRPRPVSVLLLFAGIAGVAMAIGAGWVIGRGGLPGSGSAPAQTNGQTEGAPVTPLAAIVHARQAPAEDGADEPDAGRGPGIDEAGKGSPDSSRGREKGTMKPVLSPSPPASLPAGRAESTGRDTGRDTGEGAVQADQRTRPSRPISGIATTGKVTILLPDTSHTVQVPVTARPATSGESSTAGSCRKRLAAAPLGALSLPSDPYAFVTIDGCDTGETTPLIDFPLTAGHHMILLRTADTRKSTLKVDIKLGETAMLPLVEFR